MLNVGVSSLMPNESIRSETWSQLGRDDWPRRCREDGQRQLLDVKALPFARSSHGAPFVRAKIVEALEAVGKLREGTCNLYGNGLYDGGLHNIKPSGWGEKCQDEIDYGNISRATA